MKSLPKILTCLFLLVFIIQMGCIIILLTLPQAALAERAGIVGNVEFMPQVEIPGLNQEFTKTANGGYALPGDISGIAKYIRVIYQYAIGIAGILAAVVLMFGGVLWIIAGGNSSQISEAKAWIGASLTGLVLALTSYLILYTVNPALVNLQVAGIQKVAKGPETTSQSTCCSYYPTGFGDEYASLNCSEGYTQTYCENDKRGTFLFPGGCNDNKQCEAKGSCTTIYSGNVTRCENDVLRSKCTAGMFDEGKQCPNFGSCSVSGVDYNHCSDNVTEEACKNILNGTFVNNGRCPKSCCSMGLFCKDGLENMTQEFCSARAGSFSETSYIYLASGECKDGKCVPR